MSRNLLAILLSELTTVRLICRRDGCGGVSEMSVEKLANVPEPKCPACGQHMNQNQTQPHMMLARAIKQMRDQESVKDAMHVEFVIPQPE